jgi:hypothetical protein
VREGAAIAHDRLLFVQGFVVQPCALTPSQAVPRVGNAAVAVAVSSLRWAHMPPEVVSFWIGLEGPGLARSASPVGPDGPGPALGAPRNLYYDKDAWRRATVGRHCCALRGVRPAPGAGLSLSANIHLDALNISYNRMWLRARSVEMCT